MSKKTKFDYFEAFGSQTKLAVAEADLLIEVIKNYDGAEDLKKSLEKAHELEHEADQINHAIFKSAALDFIPPIDRVDITDLSQDLDSLIDYIEDVMQRFYMYDVKEIHPDTLEFALLIKKSCEKLDEAMDEFKNFKKSKKFKQLIIDVDHYEGEADLLYLKVMRSLHTAENPDPMYVHVWSHLFNRLEKCCDSCEDIAGTMKTILLKNM